MPLALDRDQIAYGTVRVDRYLPDDGLLSLEAGTAELEGPTLVAGLGRVQQTDTSRPWMRASLDMAHWQVRGAYSTRRSDRQLALSSGAALYEDSSRLDLEALADWAPLPGRVDTQGVEVDCQLDLGPRWNARVSYTWFDFDIAEDVAFGQLVPNAPEHQVGAALSYAAPSSTPPWPTAT